MLSQLEIRKLQLARINYLAIVIGIAFLVLLGRLWYLQIAQGDNLLQAAEANAVKLVRMRAPRGTILDRKGRVLATSRPQFVVMAIKDEIENNPEALKTLCSILNISPQELDSRMSKSEDRPGSPTRVEVDVPLETVAKIGEMRMKLPGVSVEMDNLRYYPDGPAVAHIMGYLGEISQQQLEDDQKAGLDYRPGDYVGKAGLEKQYESDLRGIDGGRDVIVNAFGRVVRIEGDEHPYVQGKTLKLTIDRDLQVAADRAMGNQVGAVVAIDPRTGAVLAMVSNPGYDPNEFVKKIDKGYWNGIILNNAHPLQNRCVNNVYPPGSTFKPMMAVAGLLNNCCDLKTTVSCPGSFYFGRTFRCWKVHGGGVTFNRAIAESCDVWFYHLAIKLGIDRMADVATQFGVSEATGIDLPHESHYRDGHVGTMPSTAWKWKRYHEKWYPSQTLSCGIGQGYVQMSPLQLAVACSGVASSGKIYTPYLVDQILTPREDKVLSRTRPRLKRQVKAAPEYFKMVQNAMHMAVTSGTARSISMPDILTAGKTGSAENRGPAHAWFECFAPLDNPQIAIACIVEHGRHGATAAGPVCRAILDVYFGKKKPEEVVGKGVKVSGD